MQITSINRDNFASVGKLSFKQNVGGGGREISIDLFFEAS